MSKRPVLFDSFGYLLIKYRRGEYTGDQPHFVYHFGTMLKGITDPETRYAENYHVSMEDIQKILGWLAPAEADGRLFWRETEYIHSAEERERFQQTLATLRRLGATDIPEYDPTLAAHCNAFWNIPAQREFLKDSSVEFANPI
jgi:hypothetical protein